MTPHLPNHPSKNQIQEQKALQEALFKVMPKGRTLTFMEVCGTHTMSIRRNGLPALLPESLKLLSGPGCPVCVTPVDYLDHALELAKIDNVVLATFGDLIRVPGSYSSLEEARAQGAQVEVVYSPLDALSLARKNPKKEVVFLGVGFETTAPVVASSIRQARKEKLKNYSVLSAHKMIPPAMRALADSDDLKLDGFLCPGHVSVIIGSKPYEFLAKEHGLPCVVAGFEPLDILQSLYMLVRGATGDKPSVEIQYRRVVKKEGNKRAQEILEEVFAPVDTQWRGLGTMPLSGLAPSKDYEEWDAARRFSVSLPTPQEHKGCICGDVLRGVKNPKDCGLFGTQCTPVHPVGACMVSSEGTCAAHYKYRDISKKRSRR